MIIRRRRKIIKFLRSDEMDYNDGEENQMMEKCYIRYQIKKACCQIES